MRLVRMIVRTVFSCMFVLMFVGGTGVRMLVRMLMFMLMAVDMGMLVSMCDPIVGGLMRSRSQIARAASDRRARHVRRLILIVGLLRDCGSGNKAASR